MGLQVGIHGHPGGHPDSGGCLILERTGSWLTARADLIWAIARACVPAVKPRVCLATASAVSRAAFWLRHCLAWRETLEWGLCVGRVRLIWGIQDREDSEWKDIATKIEAKIKRELKTWAEDDD